MQTRKVLLAAGAALASGAAWRFARRVRRRIDFRGKAVFITGGSRGLGLALAYEAARRGARIAICGRDGGALDRAAHLLREEHANVLPLACDVRDARALETAIQRAHSTFGRLDMLVNNAGIISVGPLESLTRSDYEDAMNTHFWAMYSAVESVRPIFARAGGGCIVNVTSIGGKVSVPHLLAYSASKFAAVGYSEGLRAELAPANVSVTTVCPGLMRTGSPRNAWFKGQHRREYAWFTLSDTLPGLSISAKRAARAIFDAALTGKAEIVLSLPAQTIAFIHGVAPGFFSSIASIAARLLPSAGDAGRDGRRGYESTTGITESPLTALGKKAERRYNQLRN